MALFWLAPLTTCSFPWWTFHIPRISDSWDLHYTFSFIPTASCSAFLKVSLPKFPVFPLKSWPCSCWSLHTSKTTTARSAVSRSSSQAPLNHGHSGLWASAWLSREKWILLSGIPGNLFSNEKLTFLHPWACSEWGLAIPAMPSRYFLVLVQNPWFLFNGAGLSSSHTSFASILEVFPFGPKFKSFKLFYSTFCPFLACISYPSKLFLQTGSKDF